MATSSTAAATPLMHRWRGEPRAILTTVCLASFMTSLDMSIINIATPVLAQDLGVSLSAVTWVINAYLIAIAVLVIICGRLGDLVGPKRMFTGGVGLFTFASVGCGLAQNVDLLIAARALQGIGAAMLYPQAMAIIVAVYPAKRRGAAIGIWSGVSGVASIIGPLVGGLLTSLVGWRGVFFINLPIGLFLVAMATASIPMVRMEQRRRLDILGVVLAAAALICFTFALVEGEPHHWGTVWAGVTIPMIALVGAVCVVLFILVERRRQHRWPLIPFELFRGRNYALMVGAMAVVAVVVVGTTLPLAMYGQYTLGFSPLEVGAVMFPMFLVIALVAPFCGRLVDRVGGKFLLIFGLSCYAAGMAYFAWIAEPGRSWMMLMPGLLLSGLGLGCTFTPLNSIAMHDVRSEMAGAASGLFNTARQLGSVLGSSLMAVLMQIHLADAVRQETATAAEALPSSVRSDFISSTRDQMSTIGRAAEAAGESGGSVMAQTDPALSGQIEQARHLVFVHSVADAVQPTLAVLIAAVVVALCCALAVRRRPATPAQPASGEGAGDAPVAA
jgi:EmrB/QacA subfamily drug resistance transporter